MRRRLRDLEQQAGGCWRSFALVGGSRYQYDSDEIIECFCQTIERRRARDQGEQDPELHPFLAALLKARPEELERLLAGEHMVGLIISLHEDFETPRDRSKATSSSEQNNACKHLEQHGPRQPARFLGSGSQRCLENPRAYPAGTDALNNPGTIGAHGTLSGNLVYQAPQGGNELEVGL